MGHIDRYEYSELSLFGFRKLAHRYEYSELVLFHFRKLAHRCEYSKLCLVSESLHIDMNTVS